MIFSGYSPVNVPLLCHYDSDYIRITPELTGGIRIAGTLSKLEKNPWEGELPFANKLNWSKLASKLSAHVC